MYQKTEIYTCDRCGIPGPEKEFASFHAPLLPAEATALRVEIEAIAKERTPAFMQSMMGGIGHLVKTPSGINLLFCVRCQADLMPELRTWVKKALEAWLEERAQQREDAEVSG